MSEFSNTSLKLEDIPDFKGVELQPIHPGFKNILIIRFSIGLIVTGLLIAVLFVFIPLPLWIPLLVSVLSLLIFTMIYMEFFIGFPIRQFGLRELDIIYRHGFFVTKETIVPFSRIQHIEIKQDLLMRQYKLYALAIYTAGESTGDLKISGLDLDTAQKLKSKVLQKVEDE